MSKILIISQGTLEMGRNRSNRRLIARLDNPKNQKNGFDTIKSTSGEIRGSSPIFCEFKSICPDNIHKYSMKCIYGKEDCRIRKYFKKFEDLNSKKEI